MDLSFSSQSLSDASGDLLAVFADSDFENSLAALDSALDGHLFPLLAREGFTGGAGTHVTLPTLGKISATQLVIVGTGDRSPSALGKAAGQVGTTARSSGAERVVVSADIEDPTLYTQLVEFVLVGNYTYDAYRPEDDRKAEIASLTFLGDAVSSSTLEAARIRARRQRWARDLVNGPPQDMNPTTLAAAARTLADLPGVEVEVWDFERCKSEGLVGVVAVGKGSPIPGCVIHVSYRPPEVRGHVALVGKGVTFDSGGLSLKPSNYMQTMRSDMAGAATVLAATAAAAEQGLPVRVDCFVGAVENMNDGNSYKLGDILRYNNGVTVEIHNTDAEGRLVLADCLLLASRVEGVTHMVDVATLTGACVVALGDDFTGMFTEHDDLAAELSAAAAVNHEGLWRLPLHAPYKKHLKGDWSAIKNVGGRYGGAITAALFLQHFVDGPKWAHLDIAGPSFAEKAHAPYAPGGTGEMVRTLTTWIASHGTPGGR